MKQVLFLLVIWVAFIATSCENRAPEFKAGLYEVTTVFEDGSSVETFVYAMDENDVRSRIENAGNQFGTLDGNVIEFKLERVRPINQSFYYHKAEILPPRPDRR